MARTRTARAFSAGGVVYRLVGDEPPTTTTGHPDPLAAVEIALVGRLGPDIWVLPKGTPHPGEEPAEVALREVREETGLITRLIEPVGSIHYTFSRGGTRYRKEVQHFLLRAVGGDVSLHDAEYDVARWFPAQEALARLTFHNEAELLRRALDLITARLAAGSESPPQDALPSQAPRGWTE